ncbi:MAG: penicillin-binding transpeptidase domain-containing protein, partial [Pseudomonadota bacterium]
VLVKSSNIGTVHLADMIGTTRQRDFLRRLGLMDPTPIELIEGPTGRPNSPEPWRDIHRATISYGHGLSTSQIHLAAAYASIVNGGTQVTPTLLRQNHVEPGIRVVSPRVSQTVTQMLRRVVTEGTASYGEVPGYSVGGKTGTADKPNPRGGYYDDKVLASFASVFPTHDPQYVLIVTLDEPEVFAAGEDRRTAGWTAVPVAAEVIRRIAPLLGVVPTVEPNTEPGVVLTGN